MPDKRTHRGPHPKDREAFRCEHIAKLRRAVLDYSYLLSQNYNSNSALELVGNHFQLTRRERMALSRASCSDAALARRHAHKLKVFELKGRHVAVDGFNCLITVEVMLSGGVVLLCRDGAHRDLASVHGTYRHVFSTPRALALLCDVLAANAPQSVTWYLDSPVSNSGKLATLMRATFEEKRLEWQVLLVDNADPQLVGPKSVAASSDAWVLDTAEAWVDLPGTLLASTSRVPWLVDLSGARA